MSVKSKLITLTAVAGILMAGVLTVDWGDTGSGSGWEFTKDERDCQPDESERCVEWEARWTPTRAHDHFKMDVLINGEPVGRRDQSALRSPMRRTHTVKVGSTVGMTVYGPQQKGNSPEYDITCTIRNKVSGILYDSRTSFVGNRVQCFGTVH